MKISLNWLKDYIYLDDLGYQDIAKYLTSAGLEVENIIDYESIYSNIVVGLVAKVEKHPKADKLTVCQVRAGNKNYQVVCGAPNVKEGMKAPLALPGAIMPDSGMEIKKVSLRGVESFGMLCSQRELNLGDDHSGIWELDDNFQDGTELVDALKIKDVVFEIGVTPNRPDALSHIGIARELSAILDRDINYPDRKVNESNIGKFEDYGKIFVNDDDCLRYCSRIIIGAHIKESPEWLKKRLKAVGLRPINNVVDATNYVMYELGHPLHAFDLDRLEEKTIVVQRAKAGEKFIALDGKERELDETILMICDGKKSVAIAGVMGGENSGITETTRNILLESAYFNPSNIRRTSKKLQLSTDSSYRFERGADYNIVPIALERVAKLIQELAGGEILKNAVDVKRKEIQSKIVNFRYSRCEKVLGYKIEKSKLKRFFFRLGFELNEEREDNIIYKIPTFRPDIEREIDLIEEAARLNGYDNIPAVEKISVNLSSREDQSEKKEKIRDICVSLGLIEILNNSLIPEEIAKRFGNPIKILNPQSSDMSSLRTSLLPGGFQTIKRNINVGEKNLKLFEIGAVFNAKNAGVPNSFEDFEEKEKAAIFLTGNAENLNWYARDRKFDIYDLKGYVDGLIDALGLKEKVRFAFFKEKIAHYEYGFNVSIEKKIIFIGGKIQKDILRMFDIEQDVYACEIEVEDLKNYIGEKKKYKELLKFPKVYRDFAFIFDKRVDYIEVEEFIMNYNRKYLKEARIFDLFEDNKALGEDKKSMAISLTFYDENKTLTEEEVNEEFWEIIRAIEQKFKAKLRGA